MEVQRKHYLITGELRATFDRWAKDDEAKREASLAWAKSYGVETAIELRGWGHTTLMGLAPVEGKEPPAGFKLCRDKRGGEKWWGPDLKTKLGKEIQRTLAGMERHGPTLPGFSHVLVGNRLCTEGWEMVGEDLIVSIPQPSDYVPPDSRFLKMSEYHAIKEAVELVAFPGPSPSGGKETLP